MNWLGIVSAETSLLTSFFTVWGAIFFGSLGSLFLLIKRTNILSFSSLYYDLISSYEENLRKKGKNYLLEEARRQSLLASQHDNENESVWEENIDTTGWQD